MKRLTLLLTALLVVGCVSSREAQRLWTRSMATDSHAGQIELLELNGLLMEWSATSTGKGFLYHSLPMIKEKAWTFTKGGIAKDNALEVLDGDVITAVHKSGRTFEIRIEVQTPYYLKVMYREI